MSSPDEQLKRIRKYSDTSEADITVRIDTTSAASSGDNEGQTIQMQCPGNGPVSSKKKRKKGKKKTLLQRLFPFLVKHRNRRVQEAIDKTKQHRKRSQIESGLRADAKLSNLDDYYEMTRQLASGSRDVVSIGRDRVLQRVVAVKTCQETDEFNLDRKQSFINEAEITAQLDHPSIIPVYSLNKDPQDRLHLVMKLVDGQTFHQYLRQICTHYRLDGIHQFDERKSLRHRLEIFLDVCTALEYAHSRNIMHCDLKPENIMIGEYHETYVKGWGLAKLIRDPSYSAASWKPPKKIAGTPGYLSPEAIIGRLCDQRADIFSLGLILFELTTLQEAYTGESTEEVCEEIRSGVFPPIEHRFNYPISRDLKAIIRKACAHDRNDRYTHVSYLSKDIRNFLAGEETSARKWSRIARVFHFVRNHQGFAVFILVLMVLASVASSVFSLSRDFIHANDEFVREHVLARLYANSTITAHTLDRQISKLVFNMRALRAESEIILSQDFSSDRVDNIRPALVPDAPGRSTGELYPEYSPVYMDFVDLKYFSSIKLNPDISEKDLRAISEISRLQAMFARVLVTSPFNSEVAIGNSEKLRFDAVFNGVPLIRIDMIFSAGLVLRYPYRQSAGAIQDLRNTDWYMLAYEDLRDEVFWTPPLHIATSPGKKSPPVFIAALRIRKSSRSTADGVIAYVISVKSFKPLIASTGNHGKWVVSKTLVRNNGDIYYETGADIPDLPDNVTGENLYGKYQNPEVLLIARRRSYGTVVRKEKEETFVYCFAPVYGGRLFYIEKINLNKVLQSVGKKISGLDPHDAADAVFERRKESGNDKD